MPGPYFKGNTSPSSPELVPSPEGLSRAGRAFPALGQWDGSWGRDRHSETGWDEFGEPGLPVLPYLPNNWTE